MAEVESEDLDGCVPRGQNVLEFLTSPLPRQVCKMRDMIALVTQRLMSTRRRAFCQGCRWMPGRVRIGLLPVPGAPGLRPQQEGT